MDFLKSVVEVVRPFGARRQLRRMAVASLVMNVVIIVTGALVRLTDSGLGCPTWPQCTPGSYTPHAELGVHGLIEFGNRLLTFVLVLIALATWISALLFRRVDGTPDRRLRWLTFAMGLGIPFQGVIGGITVLTDLNPYVVALHLINSMVLVSLAVWLIRLTWPLPARAVGRPIRVLTVIIFALAWAVIALGTVVTGSGPHAGDEQAVRTGLDPEMISKAHAWTVYLLVIATGAAVVLLRSVAPVLLLVVELAQGVIGYVQYFTGLPIGLVALHMLGAASVIATAANVCFSVRLKAATPAESPAADHRANSDSPSPAPPDHAVSGPGQ